MRTLIVFLTIASSVAAQDTRQIPVNAVGRDALAVVKVRGNCADGTTNLLTGVCVGYKDGIATILTSGHCYRDVVNSTDIAFPYDQWRPADYIAHANDASRDIAVLAVRMPYKPPIMPINAENPPLNASVLVNGYPHGTYKQRETRGRVTGAAGPHVTYSVVPLDGESGGPVTLDGAVVALNWGADGQQGYGMPCEAIKAYLTQYCSGGVCSPSYRYVQQPQQRIIYSAPTTSAPPIPRTPTQTPPTPTVNYDELVNKVIEKIKADPELQEMLRGPAGVAGQDGQPGAAGIAGPVGAPGPPGLPGKDATVDIGQLADAILQQIPPTRLEIIGKDDIPVQVQEAAPGGVFRIPPVILSKEEDGQQFTQVKALGEPLRLKLIPVELQ